MQYNTDMDTITNVKKVSLIFFLALTGTHVLSSLMLANDYFDRIMVIVNGTLDVPAIIAGLIYAFTSAKLYLEEIGKDTKIFDMVAGIVAGVILMAVLYLNFLA